MIDPITLNARRPQDNPNGHAMLARMNEHHKALHKWALEHVSLDRAERILDIGCGGGDNLHNLGRLLPHARLWGLDYSEASIRKCREVNLEAVEAGRLRLHQGSVEQLPYEAGSFDLVTAFETVYYWPDIEKSFRRVLEALDDRGAFLICNEDSCRAGNEAVADALEMQFYTAQQLGELLHRAGFRTVHTYSHEHSRWVCAVGRK